MNDDEKTPEGRGFLHGLAAGVRRWSDIARSRRNRLVNWLVVPEDFKKVSANIEAGAFIFLFVALTDLLMGVYKTFESKYSKIDSDILKGLIELSISLLIIGFVRWISDYVDRKEGWFRLVFIVAGVLFLSLAIILGWKLALK